MYERQVVVKSDELSEGSLVYGGDGQSCSRPPPGSPASHVRKASVGAVLGDWCGEWCGHRKMGVGSRKVEASGENGEAGFIDFCDTYYQSGSLEEAVS